MGLEAATYISQLVGTNPVGATDDKSQGDDHLRLLKLTLQATFPFASSALPFPRVVQKSGNYTVLAADDHTLFELAPPPAGMTLVLPTNLATAGAVVGRWMISVYKAGVNSNNVFISSNGGGILSDYGNTNAVSFVRRCIPQAISHFIWLGGTSWLATRVPGLPVGAVFSVSQDHALVYFGYDEPNGNSFSASDFPELAAVLGGTIKPGVVNTADQAFLMVVE